MEQEIEKQQIEKQEIEKENLNQKGGPGGNPLGTAPVGPLLRQFAVPSIIAMMVGALYNIVDQFFIGQYIGELGNAATNVAFPLSTISTALALFLGVGSSAAFNLSRGRGDTEKSLYYVGNATVLLFGAGVVLGVVTELFLEPLMIFFGSPDDVLPYAMEYVQVIALGFPFLIFSNGGAHLVRADGSPRYSMICNLSGAVINCVLDPLLIIGFDMGMTGAGLATIIGQIAAAILVFRYFCNYKAGRLERKHLRVRRLVAGYAASLGIAQLCNHMAMMVVQIVMNNSLTYYGGQSMYGESIPLACAGIISKVGFVFFSICIGISHGMQPISSFNYGARQYGRVKEVLKLALAASCVVHVTTFLMFQIFPRQIIGFFGDGSEMYFTFAVRYFRIYMFAMFLNGFQPMASSFFTSIGKPMKGTFMSLTRQFIYLLPLIIIFPRFWGIDGIMFAGPIADTLAAMTALILLRHEFKNIDKLAANQS